VTSTGRSEAPVADGPHLTVFDLGLACCAVEVHAAGLDPGVLTAIGAQVTELAQAHVLVVSGTLTDVTAPQALAAYEALPEPRYVISFGACSNTGGPYWDSYSVTKGVDQLVPVDVYVPGCPPRPETLLHALKLLAERLAAS
jgi:NADH-quinone oxidoreductase subunit B